MRPPKNLVLLVRNLLDLASISQMKACNPPNWKCQICQNANDVFAVPSTEENPSTLLQALLSTPVAVLVLIHPFSVEDQIH